MFWQASALSSGPGKQLFYFVVQPALFPQVASDLITAQASINLWPGQHVTAACQLHVCTSYTALCLSIWTFYTETGIFRLYPVNWKVLGKFISCLTCSLDFTVRAKPQSWVSVHLIALNSDQSPEDTLQCSCGSALLIATKSEAALSVLFGQSNVYIYPVWLTAAATLSPALLGKITQRVLFTGGKDKRFAS